MYLRPAMTLHGLAAGVTATLVTALVSPIRRARKWEPKVDLVVGAPTVRTGDELSCFSYPKKLFEQWFDYG